MSGCLDGFNCPHIEVDCGDKRNQIASVIAGGLVVYCSSLLELVLNCKLGVSEMKVLVITTIKISILSYIYVGGLR